MIFSNLRSLFEPTRWAHIRWTSWSHGVVKILRSTKQYAIQIKWSTTFVQNYFTLAKWFCLLRLSLPKVKLNQIDFQKIITAFNHLQVIPPINDIIINKYHNTQNCIKSSFFFSSKAENNKLADKWRN